MCTAVYMQSCTQLYSMRIDVYILRIDVYPAAGARFRGGGDIVHSQSVYLHLFISYIMEFYIVVSMEFINDL